MELITVQRFNSWPKCQTDRQPRCIYRLHNVSLSGCIYVSTYSVIVTLYNQISLPILLFFFFFIIYCTWLGLNSIYKNQTTIFATEQNNPENISRIILLTFSETLLSAGGSWNSLWRPRISSNTPNSLLHSHIAPRPAFPPGCQNWSCGHTHLSLNHINYSLRPPL